MEIKAHLTNEELTQALANPGRALLAHLDLCDSCRSEVARLRRTLDEEHAATVPPEEFWQQQRTSIWQRIRTAESAPVRRVPRLAWAALVAMLALGGLWMSDARIPVANTPTQTRTQIDDNELMMAVEHVSQTDLPEALEPASLLAREMSVSASARTQVQKPEAVHEN